MGGKRCWPRYDRALWQYINKKIDVRYDVTTVMDIYDEYIAPIRKDFEWGYDFIS